MALACRNDQAIEGVVALIKVGVLVWNLAPFLLLLQSPSSLLSGRVLGGFFGQMGMGMGMENGHLLLLGWGEENKESMTSPFRLLTRKRKGKKEEWDVFENVVYI